MSKYDPRVAFLNTYQPLHTRFIRYCNSRSFGVMDAEDLAQEAILASLKNWDKIENKERLLSYMMGIVNNLLRNHRRRLKFQANWDERQLETLESRLGDPESALDVHFLLKAIEQLPKSQAEAIRLFEISGFSIKEIADIQISTSGAVKTKLSRARQQLRKILAEESTDITLNQRLQMFTSILL